MKAISLVSFLFFFSLYGMGSLNNFENFSLWLTSIREWSRQTLRFQEFLDLREAISVLEEKIKDLTANLNRRSIELDRCLEVKKLQRREYENKNNEVEEIDKEIKELKKQGSVSTSSFLSVSVAPITSVSSLLFLFYSNRNFQGLCDFSLLSNKIFFVSSIFSSLYTLLYFQDIKNTIYHYFDQTKLSQKENLEEPIKEEKKHLASIKFFLDKYEEERKDIEKEVSDLEKELLGLNSELRYKNLAFQRQKEIFQNDLMRLPGLDGQVLSLFFEVYLGLSKCNKASIYSLFSESSLYKEQKKDGNISFAFSLIDAFSKGSCVNLSDFFSYIIFTIKLDFKVKIFLPLNEEEKIRLENQPRLQIYKDQSVILLEVLIKAVKDKERILELESKPKEECDDLEKEEMSRLRLEVNDEMLIFGSPGTGKTFLIKHLLADLYEIYKDRISIFIIPADGIQKVSDLRSFEDAVNKELQKKKKVFYFLDEADGSIKNRALDGISEEKSCIVTTMLQLIENKWKGKEVYGLYCTNFKEKLDDALLRQGRINYKYELLNPHFEDRCSLVINDCRFKALIEQRINTIKEHPSSWGHWKESEKDSLGFPYSMAFFAGDTSKRKGFNSVVYFQNPQRQSRGISLLPSSQRKFPYEASPYSFVLSWLSDSCNIAATKKLCSDWVEHAESHIVKGEHVSCERFLFEENPTNYFNFLHALTILPAEYNSTEFFVLKERIGHAQKILEYSLFLRKKYNPLLSFLDRQKKHLLVEDVCPNLLDEEKKELVQSFLGGKLNLAKACALVRHFVKDSFKSKRSEFIITFLNGIKPFEIKMHYEEVLAYTKNKLSALIPFLTKANQIDLDEIEKDLCCQSKGKFFSWWDTNIESGSSEDLKHAAVFKKFIKMLISVAKSYSADVSFNNPKERFEEILKVVAEDTTIEREIYYFPFDMSCSYEQLEKSLENNDELEFSSSFIDYSEKIKEHKSNYVVNKDSVNEYPSLVSLAQDLLGEFIFDTVYSSNLRSLIEVSFDFQNEAKDMLSDFFISSFERFFQPQDIFPLLTHQLLIEDEKEILVLAQNKIVEIIQISQKRLEEAFRTLVENFMKCPNNEEHLASKPSYEKKITNASDCLKKIVFEPFKKIILEEKQLSLSSLESELLTLSGTMPQAEVSRKLFQDLSLDRQTFEISWDGFLKNFDSFCDLAPKLKKICEDKDATCFVLRRFGSQRISDCKESIKYIFEKRKTSLQDNWVEDIKYFSIEPAHFCPLSPASIPFIPSCSKGLKIQNRSHVINRIYHLLSLSQHEKATEMIGTYDQKAPLFRKFLEFTEEQRSRIAGGARGSRELTI